MEPMESLDTYTISRGRVWAVTCPPGYEENRAALVGQRVTIDGVEMLVKGVESYAVFRLSPGTPIGLLCEPIA